MFYGRAVVDVYVGNEPRVNRVCFCFPLAFLPLLDACSERAELASAGVGSVVPFAPFKMPPPPDQAGTGGVVSPMIFRRDLFPPMAALGACDFDAMGNSGNADFDNVGADRLTLAPGPGMDVGPRGAGFADAADAQGVLRGAWRNGVVFVDGPAGGRAGKRS